MITTTSFTDWYDLFEALRDTPRWTVPHFETRQIVPAVEDGFEGYGERASGSGVLVLPLPSCVPPGPKD